MPTCIAYSPGNIFFFQLHMSHVHIVMFCSRIYAPNIRRHYDEVLVHAMCILGKISSIALDDDVSGVAWGGLGHGPPILIFIIISKKKRGYR